MNFDQSFRPITRDFGFKFVDAQELLESVYLIGCRSPVHMILPNIMAEKSVIKEMTEQDDMDKYFEDIIDASDDDPSPEPPTQEYDIEKAKKEDHESNRASQEFQNGLPKEEAQRVEEAVSKFKKEDLSKTITV